MWPFWITSILAIVSIIGGILSVAVVSSFSCIVAYRVAIGVVSFFSVWAILSVLGIIRLLVSYAQIRGVYHDSTHKAPEDDSG